MFEIFEDIGFGEVRGEKLGGDGVPTLHKDGALGLKVVVQEFKTILDQFVKTRPLSLFEGLIKHLKTVNSLFELLEGTRIVCVVRAECQTYILAGEGRVVDNQLGVLEIILDALLDIHQ